MSDIFSTDDQCRAWYLRLSQLAQSSLATYSLKLPTISFSHELDQTLGKWMPKTYEIRLAIKPFLVYPWTTCVEIFKHELAHLIADQCYTGKNETAHGTSFQRACKELGISSKATLRSPQKNIQTSRKIKKLLKLAESANLNESQSATAKAQELTNRYNLKEHDEDFSFRSVGATFKRCPLWHSKIISICSRYFFVQAFKNFDSSQAVYFFEFYGEIHNLDSAEFIYNFLYVSGERHWLSHKKRGHRKDHFLMGFYDGFESTLKDNSKASSNALQHLRNPALQSFFKELNPRTRSVSYRKRIVQLSYEQGRNAGSQLNLPKKLESTHKKRFIDQKN